MRLVDDQRVVLPQHPVALDLGEQDAVGHQFDEGVVAGAGGEPDLVADGVAEVGAEFVGDAFGDGAGGEPARLGVADDALHSAAEFEAHLGDLGGLAGAGLAGDDHDLVVPDGFEQVVAAGADRQLLRVADRRDGGAALFDAEFGGGEVVGDLGGDVVARGGVADLAGAFDAPAQPPLVGEHQLGEALAEVGQRGAHR